MQIELADQQDIVTAEQAGRPIKHKTARAIAVALKLQLWQQKVEIPRDLLRFIEDGFWSDRDRFSTVVLTAADAAGEPLTEADFHTLSALTLYMGYYTDSSGGRLPLAGWPPAC